MRLFTLVSIVGFCTVPLLSSSAMAQLWAVNCEKQQCLDATVGTPNGHVQVSDCDTKKLAQQWHADGEKRPRNIQNAYEGFGKPCLDMTSKFQVVTNTCNSNLKAQDWFFAQNGQVGTIANAFFVGKCLTVAKDDTVESVDCSKAVIPLQNWKWVNVGDPNLSCK